MVIIWAISMAVFLIVATGVACFTMAMIPRRYAIELNHTYTNRMNAVSPELMAFYNKNNKWLSNNDFDPQHIAAMAELMDLLARGNRTNTLVDLFRGADETIDQNVSEFNTYGSFANNPRSATRLEIYFENTPQWAMRRTTEGSISVHSFIPISELRAGNPDDKAIHLIVIPLSDVRNRLMEQTWIIFTNNPITFDLGEKNQMNACFRLTTRGNYNKLKQELETLNVLS
jgi:hypothetical protein